MSLCLFAVAEEGTCVFSDGSYGQKLMHGDSTNVLSIRMEMRKKQVKCYIWSMALYGAETWTLRAAGQKYLESFEMWCWRRMEISLTNHVRNEEVLFSRDLE
jgi:hypothetical protein